MNTTHPDALTTQERNITLLVADGKTNTEIAATLYLSYGTVKNYVSVILAKLQLTNRAALAVYAIQHDLRTGALEEYEATPTNPDCYKDLVFLAYV